MKVRWLPGARRDLERLHRFIAYHNPSAAGRAVQKIVEAAGMLAEFPEKGKPWSDALEYRELVVSFGARGYIVRYRIEHEMVFVVRVWHGLEER